MYAVNENVCIQNNQQLATVQNTHTHHNKINQSAQLSLGKTGYSL